MARTVLPIINDREGRGIEENKTLKEGISIQTSGMYQVPVHCLFGNILNMNIFIQKYILLNLFPRNKRMYIKSTYAGLNGPCFEIMAIVKQLK